MVLEKQACGRVLLHTLGAYSSISNGRQVFRQAVAGGAGACFLGCACLAVGGVVCLAVGALAVGVVGLGLAVGVLAVGVFHGVAPLGLAVGGGVAVGVGGVAFHASNHAFHKGVQ